MILQIIDEETDIATSLASLDHFYKSCVCSFHVVESVCQYPYIGLIKGVKTNENKSYALPIIV